MCACNTSSRAPLFEGKSDGLEELWFLRVSKHHGLIMLQPVHTHMTHGGRASASFACASHCKKSIMPVHIDTNIKDQRSNIKKMHDACAHRHKYQTSNIKYQISNVKHQMSNVKDQTSNIKCKKKQHACAHRHKYHLHDCIIIRAQVGTCNNCTRSSVIMTPLHHRTIARAHP